jgi:hypothetical protein
MAGVLNHEHVSNAECLRILEDSDTFKPINFMDSSIV